MKNFNLRPFVVFLMLPLMLLNVKCTNKVEKMTNSNIHHSAFFHFKDSLNSNDKELFFNEIKKLSTIPGVIDFKVVNEISPKNPYQYGVTMEFENQQAYDAYNSHPMHVGFVQNYWLKMVENFMEIDYKKSPDL